MKDEAIDPPQPPSREMTEEEKAIEPPSYRSNPVDVGQQDRLITR